MRARIVTLIVERGWPLTLALYCVFAIVSLADDDHAFMLYTTESHVFSMACYAAAATFAVATAIKPRIDGLRWAFFVSMGFALTGRILQFPEDDVTIEGVARGTFVVAALLAHLVIQVDWLTVRRIRRREY